MAERIDKLGEALKSILNERKKVEQVERRTIRVLNRALKKVGYQVVPAGGGERQRRRGTRAVARRRRRRGKK